MTVAKQLKKYNQTRIQSLAMKRVKTAAWHMATCPNDAKGRRYWKDVVIWRCDECWKEVYATLTKEDYHNERSGKDLILDDVLIGKCPSHASSVMLGFRNLKDAKHGQSGSP